MCLPPPPHPYVVSMLVRRAESCVIIWQTDSCSAACFLSFSSFNSNAARQVFEGRPPWAGVENSEVQRLVLEGKKLPAVPKMLQDRGGGLVKLYRACLSADSAMRPSMEDVVDELTPNVYGRWTSSSPSSMSLTW